MADSSQDYALRFEDLTVDDDLPLLDRIVRYCRSGIALQRLVHVKMLAETAETVGCVFVLVVVDTFSVQRCYCRLPFRWNFSLRLCHLHLRCVSYLSSVILYPLLSSTLLFVSRWKIPLPISLCAQNETNYINTRPCTKFVG